MPKTKHRKNLAANILAVVSVLLGIAFYKCNQVFEIKLEQLGWTNEHTCGYPFFLIGALFLIIMGGISARFILQDRSNSQYILYAITPAIGLSLWDITQPVRAPFLYSSLPTNVFFSLENISLILSTNLPEITGITVLLGFVTMRINVKGSRILKQIFWVLGCGNWAVLTYSSLGCMGFLLSFIGAGFVSAFIGDTIYERVARKNEI